MKYLDLTGLGEVWANIKSYISSKIPTKTSQLQNDSNYATTSQLPSKTSQLINDSGFLTSTDISNKANKATTLSGYGITDAYTKTQVDKKVSDLVNSAPETLDTLNELANALGNDPNFATTVATQIGTKANDSDVVHKSGDETIDGTKTFSNMLTCSSTVALLGTSTDGYLSIQSGNSWDNGARISLYSKEHADYGGQFEIVAFNNENKANVFKFTIDGVVPFDVGGTLNLGTSTNKWKDVYAITFHGDVDFPITEAQIAAIVV